jgi:hypothetical protein
MKKLILSVAAIGALSVPAFAQGIYFADNSTTESYDTTIAGVPNTTQDLNLELLVGSSSSTVTTPVVTLLLNSPGTPSSGALGGTYSGNGDVLANGNLIYDNSGEEYLLTAFAGATAYFQIEAWTGSATSYAAALAQSGQYAGESSIFSEVLPAVANPAPAANDISNFGVVNLTATVVPEPSTLAMSGVGLASMLIFRRKNK